MFVVPGVVLPRLVRGFVLVLGVALCSVAVEGGGPAVRSSANPAGGWRRYAGLGLFEVAGS